MNLASRLVTRLAWDLGVTPDELLLSLPAGFVLSVLIAVVLVVLFLGGVR